MGRCFPLDQAGRDLQLSLCTPSWVSSARAAAQVGHGASPTPAPARATPGFPTQQTPWQQLPGRITHQQGSAWPQQGKDPSPAQHHTPHCQSQPQIIPPLQLHALGKALCKHRAKPFCLGLFWVFFTQKKQNPLVFPKFCRHRKGGLEDGCFYF